MGLFKREMAYMDTERWRLVEKEELCGLADECAERFPDIYLSGYVGIDVTLSFNTNAVRDMTPVLRWWAEKGYRQTRKPAVGSSITWRLGVEGGSKDVLCLHAYFKSDGSCRKVKVGTEARMVDVFEIQCGGKPVNDIIEQLAETSK